MLQVGPSLHVSSDVNVLLWQSLVQMMCSARMSVVLYGYSFQV